MGGLFSAPKPPSPPPPAPDPDRDSPLSQEAAKRRRAKAAGRGGRQSTVLTDAIAGAGSDYGGANL